MALWVFEETDMPNEFDANVIALLWFITTKVEVI